MKVTPREWNALFIPNQPSECFPKTKKGEAFSMIWARCALCRQHAPASEKNTPKEKQRKDIAIPDVFENVAGVRADMSDWIDYLHLAKVEGKWVIVNVLWELRPKTKK